MRESGTMGDCRRNSRRYPEHAASTPVASRLSANGPARGTLERSVPRHPNGVAGGIFSVNRLGRMFTEQARRRPRSPDGAGTVRIAVLRVSAGPRMAAGGLGCSPIAAECLFAVTANYS